MGLGVGKSLKVMAGSDKGVVVGQGYLPTHLVLDRMGLVDEQTQAFVVLRVFNFWLGECRDYLLMIQHIPLNH